MNQNKRAHTDQCKWYIKKNIKKKCKHVISLKKKIPILLLVILLSENSSTAKVVINIVKCVTNIII